MGVRECDDGNNQQRDGCSDECAVEKGYSCSGGSENTKDTCVSNVKVKGEFVTGQVTAGVNSGTIYVKFSDPVFITTDYLDSYSQHIKLIIKDKNGKELECLQETDAEKNSKGYYTIKIKY